MVGVDERDRKREETDRVLLLQLKSLDPCIIVAIPSIVEASDIYIM